MIKRSGYITVGVSEDIDVCDILNEVKDDDLIEEIEDRGLKIGRESIPSHRINYISICDLFGVNHYTPISELMILLESKLNKEKIN